MNIVPLINRIANSFRANNVMLNRRISVSFVTMECIKALVIITYYCYRLPITSILDIAAGSK